MHWPRWRESITAIGAFLSPLVTVVTVLVALFALLSTNEANRKGNDATLGQQKLAEQGQITDRFTKAIDQLGQEGVDKVAIRLGGIYALERIMRDSGVDERNVVEVLCAFIREHTRNAADPSQPPVPGAAIARKVATDVQAALTVLGRRANFDKPDFGHDPQFGIVDLKGAHLEGTHLEDAHMEGAHLEDALFDLAHLDGAHLKGAFLKGTVLSGAFLSDADLTAAHLEGAYVADDTHLEGVNLTGASLVGAHLLGADLSHTRGLTTENLRCAFKDGDTKLPPGVSVPPAPSGC